jgi:hypothetical protein
MFRRKLFLPGIVREDWSGSGGQPVVEIAWELFPDQPTAAN